MKLKLIFNIIIWLICTIIWLDFSFWCLSTPDLFFNILGVILIGIAAYISVITKCFTKNIIKHEKNS